MIFAALLFLVLNLYLFIRGWQALPDNAMIHSIYAGLFLIVSSALFVSVFAGNKLPLWLIRTLDTVGGYWMILFIFLLTAALLGDLLRLADHLFNIYPQWVTDNYGKTKLLYLMSVFIILTLISLIGFAVYSTPHVTRLNVTVNKSIKEGHDLTIVAASDIHLGNFIRKERLTKWVDLINSQDPDVILLAGDLFDHNMASVESQDLYKDLLRLKAVHGVFAVPGNHDYYAGIDKAIGYMEKSGIQVLRDQAITIGSGIVIIGRDDLTNKNRKPLGSLMNGVDTTLPLIVLDHQPVSFKESVKHNIDLHISGHTHNGQIFPFNKVVSKIYDLAYGYKKRDNTHMYVSSGMGLWGAPLRIGSQSEIVKVTLKGGSE